MSESKGTIIKASELVSDASLGKRMDRWFEETNVTVYKNGDLIVLEDANGKEQGTYDTVDDLVEEFEFESANTHVAKRCVEEL